MWASGSVSTLFFAGVLSNESNKLADVTLGRLCVVQTWCKKICRLINIAAILQQLADLVRPLDTEFEVLERFSLLIIQVFPILTYVLLQTT